MPSFLSNIALKGVGTLIFVILIIPVVFNMSVCVPVAAVVCVHAGQATGARGKGYQWAAASLCGAQPVLSVA